MRQLEPWRRSLELYLREVELGRLKTVDEVREEFLHSIKNKLLSPEEVLYGTYIIGGDEADIAFFRHVLMSRLRTSDRVRLHNWRQAFSRGEAFMSQWGRFIDRLEFPILPNDPALRVETMRQLHEMTDGMDCSGGAPTRRAAPSIFKQADSVEGGAYYAPVMSSQAGPYVDLSEVENMCLAMEAQIIELRARIAQSPPYQRDRGNPRRGQEQQQQARGHQQQQQPARGYQQPQQQHRGRGRGRSRTAGAGEAPQEDFQQVVDRTTT